MLKACSLEMASDKSSAEWRACKGAGGRVDGVACPDSPGDGAKGRAVRGFSTDRLSRVLPERATMPSLRASAGKWGDWAGDEATERDWGGDQFAGCRAGDEDVPGTVGRSCDGLPDARGLTLAAVSCNGDELGGDDPEAAEAEVEVEAEVEMEVEVEVEAEEGEVEAGQGAGLAEPDDRAPAQFVERTSSTAK